MKKDEPKVEEKYPMRINRYLAQKGIATRRDADTLIEKGLVLINGHKAVLGDKVMPSDAIEVRASGKPKAYRYIAYNKPKGVVTSAPQKGETDIKATISKLTDLKDVFPVGRLDKDSHGLIILTNDGRITDRLLNPIHTHDKEYVVNVRENLRPSFKMHMEKGVDIGDHVTRPAKVNIISEHAFAITITEGKRHQVRRMAEAMHLTVTDLKRVRILNIGIGKLSAGEYRILGGKELETFLKSLGL